MLEWAQSYLNLHKEVDNDYTEKYDQFKICTSKPELSKEIIPTNEEISITNKSIISVEETDIFIEVKVYRLNKSCDANIKPYIIYNDNQLKDLIHKMQNSKDELQTVAEFDETKSNKYGNDILIIIMKYYM